MSQGLGVESSCGIDHLSAGRAMDDPQQSQLSRRGGPVGETAGAITTGEPPPRRVSRRDEPAGVVDEKEGTAAEVRAAPEREIPAT